MQWKIEPYDYYDKSAVITGPEEVELTVDIDDVDTVTVMTTMEIVVDILNRPENEIKYATAQV